MATRSYRLQPSRPAPTSRIDYASLLTKEQLAAAQAPPGPVLVIAGAGSGKTRTLIFRLAWLLESGIPPEEILLLTFTNRAAREMIERAGELAGSLPGVDLRRVVGGTFHHVGNRILRRHAPLLGFREGFNILDREDQKELLASCLAELGLAVGKRRFPKADLVGDLISLAVNTQVPLAQTIEARRPHLAEHAADLQRVARRYAERKLAINVMDFDDLLLQWKRLLVEHPEVRAGLQEQSRAILVDEYQDTNRLQGDLIDLMAARHRNLTVVGDDAQSIYSFRGAEFSNILEFPARYPGCQLHKLTINYRSRPEILDLANASIAHNRRQFPKALRSHRESAGLLPAVVPARDAVQQAAFIAQRILELRDEGTPLGEIAVLYRAHYQSMEIQIELSRRGIPFSVRSGVRFFEQAHVKDVLAWLRVVANPSDELAFRRMVRLYPGVGPRIAEQLWQQVAAHAGLARPWSQVGLDGLPPKARIGWAACVDLLERLADDAGAPSQAIQTILEAGYEAMLAERFLNADSRAEDLRQLAAYALQFPDLSSFLAEVLLLSELSGEDVVETAATETPVTLSSIHQAKGLEWQVVFLAWLAEGRFPVGAALAEPDAEEEERRCFYVAVTRAKDELYLCHPLLSAPRDDQRIILRPSRFLAELEVDVRQERRPALGMGAGGPEDAALARRGGDGDDVARGPLFERWTLDEEPPPPPAPPSREALAAQARQLLQTGTDGPPTADPDASDDPEDDLPF